MTAMNPPHSTAVVDVREEDVDRFREAGYTEVKSETKKSTAKRSSSSKTSK